MVKSLNWYEVDRKISGIAIKYDKIYSREFLIDIVVGVTPDGVLPALILSELWRKPMITVGFDNMTPFPTILGERVSGTGTGIPLPKLFIINAESCSAMNKVIAHYKKLGHEFISAAIYHKDDSDGLLPNLFCYKLDADGVMAYPWGNL